VRSERALQYRDRNKILPMCAAERAKNYQTLSAILIESCLQLQTSFTHTTENPDIVA
jgi:hypothetical protein